jgi:hypothetical protein
VCMFGGGGAFPDSGREVLLGKNVTVSVNE